MRSIEARLDLAYCNGANAGINAANKTDEELSAFKASIERTHRMAMRDEPMTTHKGQTE